MAKDFKGFGTTQQSNIRVFIMQIVTWFPNPLFCDYKNKIVAKRTKQAWIVVLLAVVVCGS